MNPLLTASLDRLQSEWNSRGKEFSTHALAPQFHPYFKGPRIEVRTVYDDGTVWVRRGTVTISQGWQPTFLLLSRANAHGSSDVLKDTDEITAVHPFTTSPTRVP